ncbi:MAG: helix-turn-helix transcriptional regulator [Lachnospiraceae bacterium]
MDTIFYTAQDVADLLGVSKGHAYKLIKALNEELASKNYIIVAGKIPKAFLAEKYYGGIEYKKGEK